MRVERPYDATQIRRDEVSGYGSTATWARGGGSGLLRVLNPRRQHHELGDYRLDVVALVKRVSRFTHAVVLPLGDQLDRAPALRKRPSTTRADHACRRSAQRHAPEGLRVGRCPGKGRRSPKHASSKHDHIPAFA